MNNKNFGKTAEDIISRYDFSKFNRVEEFEAVIEDNSSMDNEMQMYKDIKKKKLLELDNTPLTRKDYDEKKFAIENECSAACKSLYNRYSEIVSIVEEKFKEFLKNTYFPNDNSKKIQKVFDVLYRHAYEDGHSSGFIEITSCLDNYYDLYREISQ
jgi:hypothetical protein